LRRGRPQPMKSRGKKYANAKRLEGPQKEEIENIRGK
jgi:hypothetical protein